MTPGFARLANSTRAKARRLQRRLALPVGYSANVAETVDDDGPPGDGCRFTGA
jgi:hypothetical protein